MIQRMRTPIALLLAAASVSCVSYSSIQKADREIYLSGATSYWIINVPFLKRCEAEGQVLKCEELKEFVEPPARRRGETAPAGSAAPAPAPAK